MCFARFLYFLKNEWCIRSNFELALSGDRWLHPGLWLLKCINLVQYQQSLSLQSSLLLRKIFLPERRKFLSIFQHGIPWINNLPILKPFPYGWHRGKTHVPADKIISAGNQLHDRFMFLYFSIYFWTTFGSQFADPFINSTSPNKEAEKIINLEIDHPFLLIFSDWWWHTWTEMRCFFPMKNVLR